MVALRRISLGPNCCVRYRCVCIHSARFHRGRSRTNRFQGAELMNRNRWPLAAIAGMAFVACVFLTGCEDESASKTANEPAAAKPKASRNEMAEQNAKAGADFLAANAKKEGVKTTPSGLQYLVL